ncbi:MAG: tetratricopeptide repeat protein, partial [Scytonema sp. PMC 1069.18]|nr:tetratricopeptide repeat protein [Scytonema sp. PMC 1069.18]MEC4887592.1 tetratricopeptide repeat protein [Scytonema sp. PMC 1070.18]
MDKKRLEAYSKLINLLVRNLSEATAILKTHSDQIDANFVQIIKQTLPVLTKSGQYDIAYWLQNIAFSLEADLFFQQGIGYFDSNQFQEALRLWKEALNIYREIGNRHKEAFSLNCLGVTYKLLGEYKQAIEYHQRSLKIAHQQNYREEKANSLGNLGNVYKLLGEY